MELEAKAAIVTGASSGVGKATALALAKGGCSVLVNYSKSRQAAEAVAEEARTHGVKALAFCADVADDGPCRAMVDAALGEFGGLDILINNAGTTAFVAHQDLEAMKTEDWDRIMAVNLRGPFQCARAAAAAMKERGSGEIVNTSSIAGIVGVGSSIAYCASKAALNNLTITLARALGPEIRVNAVAPGFIEGSWLEQGMGEAYETMKSFATMRSVLNSVCKPEDIAQAILSLICGSDLVTGQCLLCDAGLTIGTG